VTRRALAIAALVAAAAGDAAADRKAAPDKFVKAASEAFTAAGAAEQAGDLRGALGLYQRAWEISPHPSTIYNIGDVQRRLGEVAAAIKAYETYLALLPGAPDRKEVEALLDKLARTPGTIVLETGPASDPNAVDFKSAYILVDGEPRVPPGAAVKRDGGGRPIVELEVRAGERIIDIVTALTFSSQRCKVGPNRRETCAVRAKPRIDGRVVISDGARVGVTATPKGDPLTGKRFELAPGTHRLLVRDRSFECPPLVVEAPAGASEVAYVFLASAEWSGFEHCRKLDLQQHRLRFDR